MISTGLFCEAHFLMYHVTGSGCYNTQPFDLNSAEFFVVLKLDKSCWREVCELERTISDWVMTTAAQPPSQPLSMQSPKWRLSFPYHTALSVRGCLRHDFLFFTVSCYTSLSNGSVNMWTGWDCCVSAKCWGLGIFGAYCEQLCMLMCMWMHVHILVYVCNVQSVVCTVRVCGQGCFAFLIRGFFPL